MNLLGTYVGRKPILKAYFNHVKIYPSREIISSNLKIGAQGHSSKIPS
jgi:hypothetical protein